jgi:hypothetical protein
MQKSKGEREKRRQREKNGAWMCDSGSEASPKAGLVGDRWDIAAEHEIHAENGENAGSHITGAFSRENPCLSYIGGGAGNRTRVQKADRAAVYERSLRSLSRPELIPQTGLLRGQPTDKSPPEAAGAPPEQAGQVDARLRPRRRGAGGRLLHQSSFHAGLTGIRQRARSCSCCSRLLFCRFLRGQRRLGSQTALQSSLSRPFAPTRRSEAAGRGHRPPRQLSLYHRAAPDHPPFLILLRVRAGKVSASGPGPPANPRPARASTAEGSQVLLHGTDTLYG